MEPSFFLSYWRPWDENSSFIDSWGNYLRDSSLVDYGVDRIGDHIREASREQIFAIEQQTNAINTQTEIISKIGKAQIKEIQNAANHIGLRISEVRQELSSLNRKMDISLEQQRLGLILLNNVAELLKIPNSEKERQQCITLGIQFFVNASKDPDLFDDALEQFLKAEEMKKQDYFVLHRIGCIYLYAPKHLNPQLAIDYFSRAGKYALIESNPDAMRLVNILTNPIHQAYTQQTSDPEQIKLLAANSYEKAALASYIVGNDENATAYQEKALSLDKSAINSFNLAKYLIRCNKQDQAINLLEWSIDKEAPMIDAIFYDADISCEPRVIELVNKKNSELDNQIEEAVIESLELSTKITQEDRIELIPYVRLASLTGKESFVEKKNAYSTFLFEIDPAYHDMIDDVKRDRAELINSLREYQEIGILSHDNYSEYLSYLSFTNAESIHECWEICNKIRKYLRSRTPKAGDRINGGIVVSFNGFEGLMCADTLIGPAPFSLDLPAPFRLKDLPTDDIADGQLNTKALVREASPAAMACVECRIGGFNDWHLPSIKALRSALRYCPQNKEIWSSSGYSYDTYRSGYSSDTYRRLEWGIGYFDGNKISYESADDYSKKHYILPVRRFRLHYI